MPVSELETLALDRVNYTVLLGDSNKQAASGKGSVKDSGGGGLRGGEGAPKDSRASCADRTQGTHGLYRLRVLILVPLLSLLV